MSTFPLTCSKTVPEMLETARTTKLGPNSDVFEPSLPVAEISSPATSPAGAGTVKLKRLTLGSLP